MITIVAFNALLWACGESYTALAALIYIIVGASLRAMRGQSGVCCEGCGAVGLFEITCPACVGCGDTPLKAQRTESHPPRLDGATELREGGFLWTAMASPEESNSDPAIKNPALRKQPKLDAAALPSDTYTSFESRVETASAATLLLAPVKLNARGGVATVVNHFKSQQWTDRPEIPYLPPIRRNYTAAGEAKLRSTAFKSERMPYPARSHGEANLHIVLHKAMEILQVELKGVVHNFASSILVPDATKVLRYYSKKIWDEDRQYFKKQLERPSSAQHAHRHRGHLRALDGDVDDIDEVTKRGSAYCFDRSAMRGEARNKETLRNYSKDPRAGKRNVHGHKDWVDVTSTHERHATTGRVAAQENRRLERSFKMQGAWSKSQSVSMEQRRNTCTHLMSLIMRELDAESERESARVNNMPRDPKQKRVEMAKLEKARCEAADRIMRVIAEYGIVAAATEAEYLQYTIEISRRGDLERRRDDDRANTKKPKINFDTAALMLGGDSLLKDAIQSNSLGTEYDTLQSQTSDLQSPVGHRRDALSNKDRPFLAKSATNSPISPTAQLSTEVPPVILADSLSPDDGTLYRAMMRSGDFAIASKAKQLECIAVTGGNVRRGTYTDNAVITPAVIAIPKAYSSGGLSSSQKMSASEVSYARRWSNKAKHSKVMEKSLCANIAFESARKSQVNRIGMVVDRALPLWSRMSERGNARGERHYSEAFGQPMEHFFVPGQLTANLSSLAQAARGCTGTAALKGSRRAACAASVGQ